MSANEQESASSSTCSTNMGVNDLPAGDTVSGKTRSLNRKEVFGFANSNYMHSQAAKSMSNEDLSSMKFNPQQQQQVSQNVRLIQNNSTAFMGTIIDESNIVPPVTLSTTSNNGVTGPIATSATTTATDATNASSSNVQFHLNEYDDTAVNEQAAASYAAKSQLQREIPILLKCQDELFKLKEQQAELQANLEDIKSRMNDNFDKLTNEIKQNHAKSSEFINTITMIYKSNDAKFEWLENSFKKLENLDNSFHWKINDVSRSLKEEIGSIKNKV